MSPSPQNVERVQDTAHWVAMCRALESERKDALFHDPQARKLAGPLGEDLQRRLSGAMGGSWPIVARTWLIDALVRDAVRDGADAVLNLAAGLDSRPYRLELPATLTWIEVDHADMIAAKEAALVGEQPRCKLERVALDLADLEARRALFARMGERFRRVLVITEGLLVYLPPEMALGLARDLVALPSTFRWITDLPNAAVLHLVAKRSKNALQGTATMQFAPDEGPKVFEPLGWNIVSAVSVFRTAGKLKRLRFPMSLFAKLPEQPYGTPGRPWSGVCLLEPRR
ncbi:class I SAM-dependent methyltransferase [Aggregicoccus sp. 17bor-14]|uniref:class I SAM-dependent methyltransferase n=1 Tax=Myxococcaceae TaxID=31 RepID=UPI00129CB338|nr:MULTISPECIES: SAM-dependent methyltransferase [Myxococcaceae]MBF5042895.1 class I SAM-dependent methyltransferase [Simulacricoccus sp. 17bor-14]MRI88662.1 class I SAM-dependent methyltransferase [Aggregicoccus sp. 17bor-14]